LEEFRQFAQKNGGKTQQDIALEWKEEISQTTIGKALKRIGFTRKKRMQSRGGLLSVRCTKQKLKCRRSSASFSSAEERHPALLCEKLTGCAFTARVP
jgi:arginine repressor